MRHLYLSFALAATTTIVAGDAPTPTHDPAAAQKSLLARLQPLVGDWRGVGQPQRGSTTNNWLEEAQWAWNFEPGGPALVAVLPQGKYFRRLRLTADAESKNYDLVATAAASRVSARYSGSLDGENRLVLTAQAPLDDLPRRLTFRFVAGGDRLLVLLEKQAAAGDQFVRIAEIGYTRQGSGFGKSTAQRECVVTGGLGTIEVTHDGKTYYVCCTGCRDYFNANPDKVLAEHAQRKNQP